MLLGFEGTGWLKREDLRTYAGRQIPYQSGKEFCRSFVAKAVNRSNSQPAEYFPGPNVAGTNCDDILREAKAYFWNYRNQVTEPVLRASKINLFGYSRGAYMALCFAKFLQLNDYKVHFLGLFDVVSRDVSVEDVIRTTKIPNNVTHVRHAFRSPLIGSRNMSMNSAGHEWENGTKLLSEVEILELPGSHAAMGGFPTEQGPGDGPIMGQGDPKNFSRFHPCKEDTAWWEAGNFISSAALQLGVLRQSLVPVNKPANYLYNRKDWYKKEPLPQRRFETRRPY